MTPADHDRPPVGDPAPTGGRRPVLYAVGCGSPASGHLGRLVALAQQGGWEVQVVLTPYGRTFADVDALARQTGRPVRSEFQAPADPGPPAAADAFVVAPATVNTINKWAGGIADTLALALLVEAYGFAVPTVAMPFTNTAMAAHPTFRESLDRLRDWGVRVLFGDDVMPLPPPGSGAGRAADFPWQLALGAVGPARHRSEPSPVGSASGERTGMAGRLNQGRLRRLGAPPPPATPAPPASLRAAPAAPRSAPAAAPPSGAAVAGGE